MSTAVEQLRLLPGCAHCAYLSRQYSFFVFYGNH